MKKNTENQVIDEAVVAISETDGVAVEALDKLDDKRTKSIKKSGGSDTAAVKCKVVYWNKYSRNFAFNYEGQDVQITLPEPMGKCGAYVNVHYADGKYEIVK